MTANGLRVALLAQGWTGFNDASLRELAGRGAEILVSRPAADNPNVEFNVRIDEFGTDVSWSRHPSGAEITAMLDDFEPDVVLMHSWHYRPYREGLQAQQPGTLRVLWMDNIWRNTPKQWLGRVVGRYWVRRIFDAVMVPSDRTEFFARRLGFAPHDVIRGSLCADTKLFGSDPRTATEIGGRRAFLSVLRLVHHKGADVLADAYRRYRDTTEDPWDLHVVGRGEMAGHFEDLPGVVRHEFLQPAEVADLMRETSCYLNPSREDPYAVVLHEAALCGLPIITSEFVGAAPTMVSDGSNGWVTTAGRADLLADAMRRMSALPADRLAEMSDVSRSLGRRLDTPRWARNMEEELTRRLAEKRASLSG
ncbi:glycosyltransferase family 4 protein [Marmoricola sp. RAF53]|uniref:glycosyltransferase family 4 protein n=1 Tax=Marmoricola sp. RAF53 TaxID=3233059 RepID=UPI003F966C38